MAIIFDSKNVIPCYPAAADGAVSDEHREDSGETHPFLLKATDDGRDAVRPTLHEPAEQSAGKDAFEARLGPETLLDDPGRYQRLYGAGEENRSQDEREQSPEGVQPAGQAVPRVVRAAEEQVDVDAHGSQYNGALPPVPADEKLPLRDIALQLEEP